MKRLLSLMLIGSLVSASACGTETTAPTQELNPSTRAQGLNIPLLGGVLNTVSNVVAGQTWLLPVKNPISVSVHVTPTQGGVMTIPLLGVLVTVPAGAVDKPTTITMTALPGDVVALDFQPAGTTFKVPLHVTQNMLLTHWLGQSFDVVYFKQTSDVNETNKTVVVSEVIPVSMLGPIASFDIRHFSGYSASAGRGSMMRGGDE